MGTLYDMGCIVTVADEVAMVKEKKPWEVITTLGLMDTRSMGSTGTPHLSTLFPHILPTNKFYRYNCKSFIDGLPSHLRGVANAYFSGIQFTLYSSMSSQIPYSAESLLQTMFVSTIGW